MDIKIDNPQSENRETKTVLIPIGDRILGTVDPRTLSREDFEGSPELLFHGAKAAFVFSQDIDYQVFAGDYSQTAGNGLYLTESRDDAVYYSQERQKPQGGEPTVYSFLPFQSRVLDLRAASDPHQNAPVPMNLVVEYIRYIEDLFKNRFPDNHPPDFRDRSKVKEVSLYSNLNDYRFTLKRLLRENKPIDLRALLSLTGNPAHSEFAARYFTGFMLQKDYDGLVYVEGGESASETRNINSYVMFNLKKIGTYETWHQEPKVSVGN